MLVHVKGVLDRLPEVFPNKDLSHACLGNTLVQSLLGQYGIRKDELIVLKLSYNSTVSSALQALDNQLQQAA
ncbi:MAG: hypothetical protein RLZZ70_491 [Candidatus Parcubacteria bacterium]|jgi:hypothetical protein